MTQREKLEDIENRQNAKIVIYIYSFKNKLVWIWNKIKKSLRFHCKKPKVEYNRG